MEIGIKSRTKGNITYCFSDRSPIGLKNCPHLADNFCYDPSNPKANESQFREVLEDCAHLEFQALKKDLKATLRFIKAFGIKANPLYIYRIRIGFYQQQAVA